MDAAPERTTIPRLAAVIAPLALMIAVWVGYKGWGGPFPPKDGAPWPCIKIWEAVIIVCWIIVPPMYFWFEYFFIYSPPPDGKPPKPDFETFRYFRHILKELDRGQI